MKTHRLKSWPEPFRAMIEGLKTFDLRVDDREYEVGDILHLEEFKPCSKCGGCGRVWDVGDRTECGCLDPHGEYTGRSADFFVKYIQEGGMFGLHDNFVAMSVELISTVSEVGNEGN